MNVPRETIARDILEFCREKKKLFIRARYTKGRIACSITKEKYSSSQLGAGLRELNELGLVKKVSWNSWKILSYEMKKRKG